MINEIKESFEYLDEFQTEVAISKEHFEWLIEQAEQAEELRKDNKSLNMEIGAYAGRWQDLVLKMDALNEQMRLLTNSMYEPK